MKMFFLTLLLLLTPAFAHAADITITTRQQAVGVGDMLRVDVMLSSPDESVNAIEGTVTASKNLKLSRIEDGNSVVLFWVEPPKEKDGVVSFSGIIPGGYQVSGGNLFRLIFTAKTEGSALVDARDFTVLKNDGAGTPADVSLSSFSFTVQATSTGATATIPKDTEPPEPFTTTLTHDPSIFDGQWFLVFTTQDKGSGIDHYEVCEGTKCNTAESPYLFHNQGRTGIITVKAFDRAGNVQESIVLSKNVSGWIWSILVVALVFLTRLYFIFCKHIKHV